MKEKIVLTSLEFRKDGFGHPSGLLGGRLASAGELLERRTTSDERAAGSGSKGLRQADAWKAAGREKKAAAFAGRGA